MVRVKAVIFKEMQAIPEEIEIVNVTQIMDIARQFQPAVKLEDSSETATSTTGKWGDGARDDGWDLILFNLFEEGLKVLFGHFGLLPRCFITTNVDYHTFNRGWERW